jgi:putative transposase
MPKLEAVKIELSDAEYQELEQLLRRTSTPQQIALRANIILRAAAGANNSKIAQELGMSIQMSRRWRQRWRELAVTEVPVLERLKDESRPGSPSHFTMEQITQLYAIACSPPEQYDRPISHWTARELALELVNQGIVTSISERHVGRLLQEADLKPYQSNYWLNPPPTINSNRKSKISVKSTN